MKLFSSLTLEIFRYHSNFQANDPAFSLTMCDLPACAANIAVVNCISNEPWHVISQQFDILTSVDSDEPVQPSFFSLETSNDVQSVA